MRFLFLDLEWNAAYSKKHGRYINEIIEIGAVLLDGALRETAVFQRMIKSRLTKRMSGRFKELTGITNEEVAGGVSLEKALAAFTEFAAAADTVVTWSTTDLYVFLDNCKSFLSQETLPFLKFYLDLQPFVQQKLGMAGKNQMALSACAEQLGMDTADFAFHRAADDSRACAEMLRRTYDPLLLKEQIADARAPVFYEKLLFKAYYIHDLNSPDIDRGALKFRCDECGGRAVRKEPWKNRSQGFSAPWRCCACGREFRAQVRFKKTWDQVVVRRSTRDIVKEEPKDEEPAEKSPGVAVPER